MAQTLTEQLEEVESAISDVLTGGQEIQTRTGRVKMADLAALRKQRAAIQQELAAQAGDCGLIDVVYDGGA